MIIGLTPEKRCRISYVILGTMYGDVWHKQGEIYWIIQIRQIKSDELYSRILPQVTAMPFIAFYLCDKTGNISGQKPS